MVKSIFWNFNFMKILTFKIYTHTGTERFSNNPQNWWWWWIWRSVSFLEFLYTILVRLVRNENIFNEISLGFFPFWCLYYDDKPILSYRSRQNKILKCNKINVPQTLHVRFFCCRKEILLIKFSISFFRNPTLSP